MVEVQYKVILNTETGKLIPVQSKNRNMNLDICITDLFLSALFTLDFKLSYI